MSTSSPSVDPWDTPYSESESSGFPDQCKNFSEGRHCKLWNKGSCPFMHDFKFRMAALDEIRKRKATKKTALREKQDQEHAAIKIKAQVNGKGKNNSPTTRSNALRPLDVNALKSSNNTKKNSGKGTYSTAASIISISASKENKFSTNAFLLAKKSLTESSEAVSKALEPVPAAKKAKNSKSMKTVGPTSKATVALARTASAEVSTSPSDVTSFEVAKVDGQTGKKIVAECQTSWKKDPSMIASRLKLHQIYEQSKENNLVETPLKSLEISHAEDRAAPSTTRITRNDSLSAIYKVGAYNFKDYSQTSIAAYVNDTIRYNSTIDTSCVLDFYSDSGERYSLVLIPHEEVVKFMRTVESEHNAEICRDFIQDKSCSTIYVDGCPHSHNTQYRQQVWKAMKNYMKVHHPTYDQMKQNFNSKVTQLDTKSDGMVTYVPLPAASKNTVLKVPFECEYAKKIESLAPPTPVSFPLKGNDWVNDERAQLFAWVKANLSPATRAKHLKSYLEQGKIPMEAIDILPAVRARRDVFQFFPQLPGELRNKVWQYAIDAQPIDCLVKQGWEYMINGNELGRRLEQINCGNPFLYVNSESRSLCLPRHEITFGNQFHPDRILFDYERDRLFLIAQSHWDLCDMVENMFVHKDRRRIRFLMIPLRNYLQHREDTCRAITSFSHLETVWFIVSDGKEEEQWSKDKHLPKRIGNGLQQMWLWRFKKKQPELIPRTPTVILNVVPAQVVHGLKIDGCRWAR